MAKSCRSRLAAPLMLGLLTAIPLSAARPATSKSELKSDVKTLADSGKRSTAKTPIPVDRDTEQKVNRLVEQHLPELKSVLKRLATDQPREYDRAVRDLARSAKKLDAAKSRDERLYELDVELLKAQTEANLLTAKLKVRDSQSDRKKLRAAAQRLLQAQIHRADYDVQLIRARLQRTQQQLDAAEKRLEAKQENNEQQLEKSYLGMLRKAGRQPEGKSPSARTKK